MNYARPLAAVLTIASLAAAPGQTFRTGADGVTVNVSVRDRSQPIAGLTAADFELLDNGVAQRITSVALGSVPVDLTVVLDTSGSVSGPAFAQLTEDVKKISGMLEAEDRLRLLTFGSTVRETQALRAQAGGPPALDAVPSGATSFFHAIVAALLPEASPGRPHLVVVLSDGADNVSLLDAKDVDAVARRSDAVLYLVLKGDPSRVSIGHTGWVPFTETADGTSRKPLRATAEATGGRLLVEKGSDSIAESFKRVLDEFRSSYVLYFSPASRERGWHELTVRVRSGNYTIRARKGYDR
jgi:von Willebrand factor type A domain-containing protein